MRGDGGKNGVTAGQQVGVAGSGIREELVVR